MSYSDKLDQSKQKVYNHAIATKIRDLMGKLRKSSNEDRKRRWIWELLQNAKDAGHDHQDVKVKIDFGYNENSGHLTFKHNGKPFSVDNITFLIEQVSTKDQKIEEGEKPKETGKFGTGFLTTHLLSEVVQIEGVIKEPDEPYKQFKFSLDRSARELDQIMTNVNEALGLLNTLDTKPAYDNYEAKAFNTSFSYVLDFKAIEVAKAGLLDLDFCLPFTLIFLQQIESVDTPGFTYSLLKDLTKLLNDVTIYYVKKEDFLDAEVIAIATLTVDFTTIAIMIDEQDEVITIKDFNVKTPKLFCDFPLVGTEDFYFPTIINNSLFSPTEPRDGVDLTDADDRDIEKNKKIISEAVFLYNKLLSVASKHNWQNIHLLSKVNFPKEKEWLSSKWFEREILIPLRKELLVTPIVDTPGGSRVAILLPDGKENVYFPSGSKEVRDGLWDLAITWLPNKLPKKEHLDNWAKLMWGDFPKIDLERISKTIETKETVENIKIMLLGNDPIAWLNSYFALLEIEGKVIAKVINDTYGVIPNQNGILKKRAELFIDVENNIEDELKNVLKILDNDPRDYLVYPHIHTGSEIKYTVKSQDEIITEINRIIKEGGNDNIASACNYLIGLFSNEADFPKERELIYDFSKAAFPDYIPDKKTIAKWNNDIWQEADKLEIKWIVDFISRSGSIANLTQEIGLDDGNQSLKWLDTFISFLNKYGYESKTNLKTSPILPNQNGRYKIKDDLFLDDGDIDETLKDISLRLGFDIREELLDRNIYLDLPENRTRNNKFLAGEITQLVIPKFQELDRVEETKEIFKSLFLWFQSNKSTAELIFENLYKNRHKLYDDEMIVENMEKAEQFSELMGEFKFKSIDDLRNALSNNVGSDNRKDFLPVTKDTLASLGITSIEEFESALENPEFAANFKHTSDPTKEMFIYAKALIDRAKRNIIEYLKTCPEYDCSYFEEIAPTVVGGINKNGSPIYVVVRPSDNGIVLVYYSSEKDILEQDNVELWIENGKDEPQLLTLGKILKKTGINKIPV